MKTLKNSLAMMAILVAVGSAVAMKPAKRSGQLYGRDASGVWHNIEMTPNVSCEPASDVCKAYFESQPAPDAEPAPEDVFVDNGYITP